MLSARPWVTSRASARQRLSPRDGSAAALAFVAMLACLYTAVMWRTFPAAQWNTGADFVYASWRMSHGAWLYRDVLGEQTPLIYLIGAIAYRLWPRPDVFMALALVMRCATVLGVFGLARACRFSLLLSAASAIVYLLLPMGFFFDARFEPNILITLGGVICTLAIARRSRKSVVIAGIAGGVFVFAKLTFMPVLLALGIYLFLTRRALFYPYFLAASATLLSAVVLGWMVIGPAFVRGALFAHAGSALSLENFAVSVRYVWNMEGLVVLVAIVGAIVGFRCGGPGRLLAFYLAGGLATIAVTFKMGSLAPEMLTGEPAVALCAMLAMERVFAVWRHRNMERRLLARLLLLPLALLVVGQALAVRDDWMTIAMAQPSRDIPCEVSVLTNRANAHTQVIAPAYTAFLAQRQIVDGISDFPNWLVRVQRGDATALAQSRSVAHLLQARHLPLVILDPNTPLPPLDQHALVTAYTPLTRCGSATVFVPRR